jgi:hypothetical protein
MNQKKVMPDWTTTTGQQEASKTFHVKYKLLRLNIFYLAQKRLATMKRKKSETDKVDIKYFNKKDEHYTMLIIIFNFSFKMYIFNFPFKLIFLSELVKFFSMQ